MSQDCNHDCSSCGANCDSRNAPHKTEQNSLSEVKKVIAVVSGKGGVGKSLVTSLLAVLARRKGFEVAVMDADVTGPSIPKVFGLKTRAEGTDMGIFPVRTKTGIKAISLNLLLENETDPVVWRGPVIAGAVKQFWTDVIWDKVDYMFVDMPPGTGDVPLTVFQSLPVSGIIIVTSPQELVSMIVEKAIKMAELMNVPVLGIVENMAYFECDNCFKRHYIYGKSSAKEIAEAHGVASFAEIPISADLAKLCDKGLIELFEGDWLNGLSDAIE
ncbi:MAG: Mrp/NBP35 family ATP-binding protein [Clostridia bacterium]|nr:Mrp/NBP35 family ATP-binding protein [Clostridia bacterium]